MQKNEVEIVLTAKDKASSVIESASSSVKKSLTNVEDSAKRTDGNLKKSFDAMANAGKVAFAAIGIAAAAVGVALFKMAEDANKANVIQEKFSYMLKSIAGASDQQTEALSKLAKQLMWKTGIDDENIKNGMAQLATFKMTAKQIEKMTPALLDMAAAYQMNTGEISDLTSISVLLGKAQGAELYSALRKVGVIFNETQLAVLETADAETRLGIITGELKNEFGGVAEAMFAKDSFGQAKLAINELKESIGTITLKALAPFLIKVADVAKVLGALVDNGGDAKRALNQLREEGIKITPIMEKAFGAFDWIIKNKDILITGLTILAAVIGTTLVAAFLAWAASVWASTIALLANPVTWVVLAIVALIAAIVLCIVYWDEVSAAILKFVDVASKYIDTFKELVVMKWKEMTNWIVKNTGETVNKVLEFFKKIGKSIGFDTTGIENTMNGIEEIMRQSQKEYDDQAKEFQRTWDDALNATSDMFSSTMGRAMDDTNKIVEDGVNKATETYEVVSGDSLSKIAEKYGTTWQQIWEDNKQLVGNNPDLIFPGQILTITKNGLSKVSTEVAKSSQNTATTLGVGFINGAKQSNAIPTYLGPNLNTASTMVGSSVGIINGKLDNIRTTAAGVSASMNNSLTNNSILASNNSTSWIQKIIDKIWGIKNAANGVSGFLGGIFGGGGGGGQSGAYAVGGVVTETHMALVHKGERIIPAGASTKNINDSGNVTININGGGNSNNMKATLKAVLRKQQLQALYR